MESGEERKEVNEKKEKSRNRNTRKKMMMTRILIADDQCDHKRRAPGSCTHADLEVWGRRGTAGGRWTRSGRDTGSPTWLFSIS